jgi:hypothetical protein
MRNMAYATGNPKSKKQLKEWIAEGKTVRVYPPGMGSVPENGTVSIEGPHYPQAHKWYGTGTMKDGVLVKVK